MLFSIILLMVEILKVDCILIHFDRIFSLPVTECLIVYPDMKCVNPSVICLIA